MKLGSNYRVIIESSHANRHLRAVRPVAAEQAGTTVYTEHFHCAFASSVNLDQFFTLEETELFLQYPRLRAHSRARMLAAAVAVTVIGLEERRVDFKTHAATQTAAMDRLFHVRILNRMHVVASCLTADDADPPAPRLRRDSITDNQNERRVKHGDGAEGLQHQLLTSDL